MKEDYSLYKYYKGEENSPFDCEKEDSKNLFWGIERAHYNQMKKNGVEFQNIFFEYLNSYIQENSYDKNIMTDESIPKEKRALILYIDLMIGKWRPYDCHLIFEY
jgi:hypothetical protein